VPQNRLLARSPRMNSGCMKSVMKRRLMAVNAT
jgi:hypothetical protein